MSAAVMVGMWDAGRRRGDAAVPATERRRLCGPHVGRPLRPSLAPIVTTACFQHVHRRQHQRPGGHVLAANICKAHNSTRSAKHTITSIQVFGVSTAYCAPSPTTPSSPVARFSMAAATAPVSQAAAAAPVSSPLETIATRATS
ncbi:hypothetical protein BDA96_10G339800 [Sorghum bicolor]|uniref:Uncharacterized protein n=2 Tax=Sorghum bicolor TaxID=4558 RepID=A0A921U2D3_SORBI|nr:hypothetical protein BDA96_10G339800 [Sorghum bicolor]KXG20861.1 hypothetical protein SORBI_3010G263200 [Sorghum bicolor]